MNYVLVNLSTATDLTGPLLLQMASALQRQLIEHYASLWEAQGAGVALADSLSVVTENDCPVLLFDNANQAGELGFHATMPDGRPYAKVFTQPIYQAGGGAIQGPYTVSETGSHEILETEADPYINCWYDMPDGVTEDAGELCDRVQNTGYDLDGVKVSNFLGPRAFSQGPGPYDWLRLLGSPFDLLPGGYALRRTGGPSGSIVDVWGNEMPEWQREAKRHPASRSQKRKIRVARP